MKKTEVISILCVVFLLISLCIWASPTTGKGSKRTLSETKLKTDSAIVRLNPDTICARVYIRTKSKSEIDSIRCLLKAMVYVESSFHIDTVNRKEKAYGCLQIREQLRKEANRLGNTKYDTTDCKNLLKSVDIFNIIQKHYNPGFNCERAARIWNGGPNGMNKENTRIYWNKVKTRMLCYLLN